MFTEHNTNGQYTDKQIAWLNARLITLYPLADSPDDFDYDEQLVKHYSERVRDELTSNTEKRYMNPATGSTDDYAGWWYADENGVEVNAVDRGEVIAVRKNARGEWVEA